jgi:endonuclease/exonuclease/phosphatase family metal-dependent hydrolase
LEIEVASFNLNNLFSRFNWSGTADPAEAGVVYLRRDPDGSETELPDVDYVVQHRGTDRRRLFRGKLIGAKDPAMTAAVTARVLDMDADVLLVQEVEDQLALEDFNRDHLGGRYRELTVIDGNDPRFIDVGILVRGDVRLGRVTTWKHARHPERPDTPIFSRDLLEVELIDGAGDRLLTVFNTHLKSHFVDAWNPIEHRRKTPQEIAAEQRDADTLRRLQADTVARIVGARIAEPVLLAGDMNDPPESAAFASWPQLGLVNALEHAAETRPPPHSANPEDVPPSPVWSDRFPVAGGPDQFRLFDHIWLGPALSGAVGVPLIHRRRSWTRDGSDHDPVSVTLTL